MMVCHYLFIFVSYFFYFCYLRCWICKILNRKFLVPNFHCVPSLRRIVKFVHCNDPIFIDFINIMLPLFCQLPTQAIPSLLVSVSCKFLKYYLFYVS